MLNDYKNVEKIGQGMYGTVYLVKNTVGDKFALKTVKINPFSAEQSLREVQATKLISHPNLVKIFDYKINEEFLQILMEYCQNGNLLSIINSNILKRDHQKCISIFSQIIDAGVTINRKGVIHRDIKPENIMVTQSPQGPILKLGDFGCATGQIEGSATILSSSFQKGTAIYSSPQVLENNVYSSKCDVWSTGCILYQIYFGIHPFLKESVQKIKDKIKKFTNQLKFPEYAHPKIKYFLKLSLQYQQKQRASWKQIQYALSFFNTKKVKEFEFLLSYLHQLSGIVSIINQQIWQNRKDTQLNKQTHKAFAFYMYGVEHGIHKMIVDLIDQKEQYEGLFSQERSKLQPNVFHKMLIKAKKNQQISRQVYQKIHGHLKQSSSTKKLIEKVPTKRNAIFANIEYSIRYGKQLLDQVIHSENPEIKVKQNRGYKLLSKWINFLKWFVPQKNPKLKQIQMEVVDRATLSWIKQELSSGLL